MQHQALKHKIARVCAALTIEGICKGSLKRKMDDRPSFMKPTSPLDRHAIHKRKSLRMCLSLTSRLLKTDLNFLLCVKCNSSGFLVAHK